MTPPAADLPGSGEERDVFIRPRLPRPMLEFGVSLWPVLLALCLLLSLGAALAVPVWRYALRGDFSWLGGAVLYAGLWAGLFWGLKKSDGLCEFRLVLAMVGLSALLKLALVWISIPMPLHSDQALFHSFVRSMADHRLDPDAMSALSSIYDYPVWAGRVLPFHYAVRLWAGAKDVLWVRLLNIALSSAILLCTYGFARRLLPPGGAKWPVFLLLALPFQSVVVTDYSHHLFASFYFLLTMWCVWELVFSSLSLRTRLGLSLVTGVGLLLMMWQRGTHWIALAVWVALSGWAFFAGMPWPRWWALVLAAVVIPLVIALPLAAPYDAWVASHDRHQLNSVLPAFMARGWCPESQGEYCGRYEQLDRVTPWPCKAPAMFRLVASQIRRNPGVVCFAFPLLKTAKLFLVGYASNFEEGLSYMSSRGLPWARGMRLAASPVFLGLAFWGCLILAQKPMRRLRWLPIGLALLVTWGAYVFFGETSPRYSIFCQPFLALLGGVALSRRKTEGPLVWTPLAWRSAWIILGGGAIMGTIALGVRLQPEHRFFGSLDEGWTSMSGAGASKTGVEPGPYRPFEAIFRMEEGMSEIQAEWLLPERPPEATRLTFYVLDSSASDGRLLLRVETAATGGFEWQTGGLPIPFHAQMALPPESRHVRFMLRSLDGPVRRPAWVVLGYVAVSKERHTP